MVDEKRLTALIEQAKYCSAEELADYLIAAGLTLPTHCKECEEYDPGFVRPYLGWCRNWESCVRESGYCHLAERRPDERKTD